MDFNTFEKNMEKHYPELKLYLWKLSLADFQRITGFSVFGRDGNFYDLYNYIEENEHIHSFWML